MILFTWGKTPLEGAAACNFHCWAAYVMGGKWWASVGVARAYAWPHSGLGLDHSEDWSISLNLRHWRGLGPDHFYHDGPHCGWRLGPLRVGWYPRSGDCDRCYYGEERA